MSSFLQATKKVLSTPPVPGPSSSAARKRRASAPVNATDTLAPTTSAARAAPAVVPPEPTATGRAVNAALIQPVMAVAGSVMELNLRRHGFSSSKVETPEGAVHMWDGQGMCPEGPTVVFLHGLATFASEYPAALINLLKTSRRVIAVDLPGAGRSFTFTPEQQSSGPRHCAAVAVRAVCHAVKQKTSEDLVLVGHSLGGFIAGACCLDEGFRTQVKHLILVSPDGAPWPEADLEAARTMMHVRHYKDALATAQRNWQNQPVLSHVMAPFIWARFAEAKVRTMVDSDMFEPTFAPEQLAALPARTLLIVGQKEGEYVAAGRLAYFQANLPAGYALARPDVAHGDITGGPACLMELISDYAAGKDVGTQPRPL